MTSPPPSPQFSGRVINVVGTLPWQVVRPTAAADWDVKPAYGNSALHLAQAYMLNHTGWETHIVGWTGELETTSCRGPYPDDSDGLYLGASEKLAIEAKMHALNGLPNVHPVWLLRKNQLQWRDYAESVLWPLFHYIQPLLELMDDAEAWHNYVRFNEAFMLTVRLVYRPGDVVWVNDYYLLLLPQLIRMEFPDAHIGLFVHGPFPLSEYFRCVGKRTQLLEGMLGATQVGFQSHEFARHFVSCCTRVVGCEMKDVGAEALAKAVERQVSITDDDDLPTGAPFESNNGLPDPEQSLQVVSYYGAQIEVFLIPVGIDVQRVSTAAFSKEVTEKTAAIRELYRGKSIIIGRDRLSEVRGVVQKLQAYEQFLKDHPEWRTKVVLIQVLTPGPVQDKRYEKKVLELIAGINSLYGTFDHTPVQHYQMRVLEAEYFALMRAADLAVVTLLRDGMNTTSFEFVVCQHENNLPLILSEFTGTASVLSPATLVNPWDLGEVSRAIYQCLELSPATKKRAEEELYHQVTTHDIKAWVTGFLSRLVNTVESSAQVKRTPALNRPMVLQCYQQASKRIFLFDYDGTLTPIVQDPDAAIPSQRLQQVFAALCRDPHNQVWIISGRDQAFLEKWFGGGRYNVGLSAEHGCFMKDVGSDEWVNLAAKVDMLWQKEVAEVFDRYTKETPGSFTERKKVALTWHHRRADPMFGNYQAAALFKELCSTITKRYDVDVMVGKANIEVRPRLLNKGEIVKRLVLLPHGAKQEDLSTEAVDHGLLPDFVMCAGDDKTDEDMFKALDGVQREWARAKRETQADGHYNVFTVAVGPPLKQTDALLHLTDPYGVIETLGLLLGQVLLFEAAGSVALDDRGHVEGGESSLKSKIKVQEMERRRTDPE